VEDRIGKIATVLYVDDENINLKLFEINFKQKFKVVTANSGIIGLEKLKDDPAISVVISDMKMPGMNGIEFIKTAKRLYPNVVFYILTGYDITDEIEAALNDRLINKYFRKPFNIKEIETSVTEALK
jgi:two-component system, response regulator, stage 0 sporulation protein F